jgi:hypothetical protein
MSDPPSADAVRTQMQQIRCEIDQDLDEMVVSARNMVDWKHYVKTYPWVCLWAAAAVGFLIVPKRSTTIHPDLATLTERARTGHFIAEPVPSATRGLVDTLLATVASIVVRNAIGLLGQSAAKLLGRVDDVRLRPPPTNDGA